MKTTISRALLGAFVVTSCLAIKVSVYYESLCYDSMVFITNQLHPAFLDLHRYIDIYIEFLPYGKASHSFYNNKWHFSCQHGRSECNGNKFQSCALSHTADAKKSVEFVNCVMSLMDPSRAADMTECAKRQKLDLAKIWKCFSSDEGDILLAANGNKTRLLTPRLSFVPTIVFEGSYDSVIQAESLKDFAALVCSRINGTKPKICENKVYQN